VIANLAGQTIETFLGRLASRQPAPGGGATAALHVAQAAALVGMVARYTTGERFAEHATIVEPAIEKSDADRTAALRLAADDEIAFTAVTDAYRRPRGTAEEQQRRSALIAQATAAAARPPVGVIKLAESVLSTAEELLPVANPNVITDVAAAAGAARAAATTARLNVEINLGGVRDEATRSDLLHELERVDPLVARADVVEQAVRVLLR
jgi:methenyltetrahydrofolate cyclohydrolase